mmetsp:Transcript_11540/g.26812  ORF Transcript_11540/g.26812 Transcript_11540/m.26812 type:complete len:364 (+) Transcript_11540:81-1172(+)
MSGFAYDPQRGVLANIVDVSHSVLPSVFKKYEYWCFLALHVGIKLLYVFGYLAEATDRMSMFYIDWDHVKVITALTTFFEVFYSNQCFGRYMELYSLTRNLLGTLDNFSFEMRVYVRDDHRRHLRLATRYFLASVVLFFFEAQNAPVSQNEWEQLQKFGLIQEAEKDYLDGFSKSQRSLIVLHWAAEVVQLAIKSSGAPSNTLKELVTKLEKARDAQQALIDMLNFPVPFAYFHLLNVMLVVNLIMWAYAMALTESYFSTIIFICCMTIFMGMLELANQFSNPFGDDDVDFPMNSWLSEFIEEVVVLCEYEYEPKEAGWEAELREQTSLEAKVKGAKFTLAVDELGQASQTLGGRRQSTLASE